MTASLAARFEAARLAPDYARAMARARPVLRRRLWIDTVGSQILIALVLASSILIRIAAYPDNAGFWIPLGICAWVAVQILLMRARRAPITRRLAIVDDNWVGHQPGGWTGAVVTREVTLHFEDGACGSYPATAQGFAEADAPSVGVAFFRRGTLIAFERLEA